MPHIKPEIVDAFSASVQVVCALVSITLLSGSTCGCSDSDTSHRPASESDASDPQLDAWYHAYDQLWSSDLSESQRANTREAAPYFLFLNEPKLAAKEFNLKQRNAKSEAEATRIYWSAMIHFNTLRRELSPQAWENLLKNLRETLQEAHNLSHSDQARLLSWSAMLREVEAIAALDVKTVDERAVAWAAEYKAWLQKAAAYRLAAMVETDQQNAEKASTDLSNTWGELNNAAADISASCMKVRAALSNEYNTEFVDIKLQ